MALGSAVLSCRCWPQSPLYFKGWATLGKSWINLKSCFPQSFLWVLLSLLLTGKNYLQLPLIRLLWALPSAGFPFMFGIQVNLWSSKAGPFRAGRLQLSCAEHCSAHWKGSCRCAVLRVESLPDGEGRHRGDMGVFLVEHARGTLQTRINLCPNTELSFQSCFSITDINKKRPIPPDCYICIFFSFNLHTAEPNYFLSSKKRKTSPQNVLTVSFHINFFRMLYELLKMQGE